jgi:hypothetical protein
MSKNFLPAICSLFPESKSPRQSVRLSWRLVRRKGRPFLMAPEKSRSAADSLMLYSAHRPLGKLWRSLVALILSTPPLPKFLDEVAIEADTASEFMQFLALQSGIAASQLPSPAIQFPGDPAKKMQLVLLLFDAGGQPIRVVKVGLDSACRGTVEREADLLSNFPKHGIGYAALTGRFSSDTISAFAADFLSGDSLDNDLGIESLFHDWLSDEPCEPIQNLVAWGELQSAALAADLPHWPLLRDALAEQTVRTTISHGDFTPWNVRIMGSGDIRAFDWERGHLKGVPAWDWFHFIVQSRILVKRNTPERVAAELEQLVGSPRFQNYAADAGIREIIEPLLLAYLLQQQLVVRPSEGSDETDALFRLLWKKWRAKETADKPQPAQANDLLMPTR